MYLENCKEPYILGQIKKKRVIYFVKNSLIVCDGGNIWVENAMEME